jgi:pantothenate kinase
MLHLFSVYILNRTFFVSLKQLAQQNLMLINGIHEQISINSFKKIYNSLLKNLKLSVGTQVDWDDLNEKQSMLLW